MEILYYTIEAVIKMSIIAFIAILINIIYRKHND